MTVATSEVMKMTVNVSEGIMRRVTQTTCEECRLQRRR